MDLGGNRKVLVERNGRGLLQTRLGFVALTGLDHMYDPGGDAWILEKVGEAWRARRHASLPATPKAAAALDDGTLLVASSQGIHSISPQGQVDPVPALDPVEPAAGAAKDCPPVEPDAGRHGVPSPR